MYTMKKAS